MKPSGLQEKYMMKIKYNTHAKIEMPDLQRYPINL